MGSREFALQLRTSDSVPRRTLRPERASIQNLRGFEPAETADRCPAKLGHAGRMGCVPVGAALPDCHRDHDCLPVLRPAAQEMRSEEHTSELQSRGLISYAVFCLKKK